LTPGRAEPRFGASSTATPDAKTIRRERKTNMDSEYDDYSSENDYDDDYDDYNVDDYDPNEPTEN